MAPTRLAAAVQLLRAPELVRSDPQRLRTYLLVNAVALWASAAALLLLRLTVIPSRTIVRDLVVVVAAGLLVLLAQWLAGRGRTEPAALLILLTNWAVASLLTWLTPFIAPVGLLALLVPLVIVSDHLPVRARTVLVPATVPLAGLVAALGEWRRTEVPASGATAADALVVGAFVAVVFLVLVVGLRDIVRRLGRRTRELEQSQARLAQASLDARREIERDLHDGAQQRLATLAVDLGRANRLCDAEPARAREIVHGLQVQLEEAIRELRDLAHGIYPPLLGQGGLAGALPAAARRTSLPCVVEVRGVGRYDPALEWAVYFCCLEAMQNADRHGDGTLIRVAVTDGPHGLAFSVTDDGVGFDPDTVRDSPGLTGMADRIRAVGGELRVDSAPGRGTSVVGSFPPSRPDR